MSDIVGGGWGEGGGVPSVEEFARDCLPRFKKRHKCEFVPRLLSMIVEPQRGTHRAQWDTGLHEYS